MTPRRAGALPAPRGMGNVLDDALPALLLPPAVAPGGSNAWACWWRYKVAALNAHQRIHLWRGSPAAASARLQRGDAAVHAGASAWDAANAEQTTASTQLCLTMQTKASCFSILHYNTSSHSRTLSLLHEQP